MSGDVSFALELRDLHHRFGATAVLRGVNLQVRAGERIGVIGPNGAGKSTLFNLVSGRWAPSRGQILLGGRRIDGCEPQHIHRLGLARSFQTSCLFPRLSAFEQLRTALLCARGQGLCFWQGLSRRHEINDRARALLDRIGLAARADTPAMDLSYAEQRALELGLTVAGDTPVLLLDEPTAGMSRAESARCVALVDELTAGRTVLVVEHDMGVVFALADRIAVLVRGELIAFDTPAAVRADPKVRAAYLGSMPADAAAT